MRLMAKDIKEVVSGNILYFAKLQHLNLRQLSTLSGINYSVLAHTIQANQPYGVSVVNLGKIAEALEVSPGDLVDDWREDDEGDEAL